MGIATGEDIGAGVFKMWCAWVEEMPQRVEKRYAQAGGQPRNLGRVAQECSILIWAAQDFAIYMAVREQSACDTIRGKRDALLLATAEQHPEEFQRLRNEINSGLARYGPLFAALPEGKGDGLRSIGSEFARSIGDEGFWTMQVGIAEYHATFVATTHFVHECMDEGA